MNRLANLDIIANDQLRYYGLAVGKNIEMLRRRRAEPSEPSIPSLFIHHTIWYDTPSTGHRMEQQHDQLKRRDYLRI